ncbi:ABC transporter ATP-binding protein [Muribaculaceae bacterium Isolate-039 (Harlan)]|jgi:ATP-binding cassette subfamily F protein uup|uniref:ABC transporter ATP-binding protein n=3 Tax=Duncaniella muris TaxID=2094150 RepID=A0A2V1ILR4_9BACT|nr:MULTISPECIES: ABC-F family ATP-binding cassette domain-containing protein [Duncaniella]ROS91066.1 ABC transporter ATP-binding protein [Muribaculaceae bacterium Isolate-039 (Harlan)]ROS96959.1 ABC transporter ATP-binding protein [Muribaculaceae bacterium Isolate-077 (Janvier)]ROS99207.1 ABC transporter ATP-binding protein [Muribaculaceae bacterium Isolate-083 (Janvier)]ROT00895.1 ABC transporter ATP-binding protein [Muribaculaceae bacterium Isolate-084 (Janvier)]PWB03584.1 ABC transporter AT
MKPYLQVEDLTKSYGDRMLFDSVTFGINEGDKIGLIAKNGTGKSTLLRILSGEEAPDSGSVTFRNGLRVGFLAQIPDFAPGKSILDNLLAAMPEEHHEDWNREDRVRQMLSQLGISDCGIMPEHMSGGQIKRAALAQVFLASPDLLILDEPTNHLDLETVEWLENYLTRQRITLLMVTHDRYFLDRVCNKIIEIDMQQIFTYEGNFDLYLKRRAERIEALTGELAKVRNTLRKEQEWMRRQPQARAGKARYRINAFYDLKERSRANYTERQIDPTDVRSSYIGSKIFEAEGISKRFGEKVILDDFTYTFARYEKLGIVGGNGVGKSTFVKMLQGLVAPDSGEWNVGETVRFGYYSQEGLQLPPNKKVIDAITDLTDDIVLDNGATRLSPMQFLNRFLFTPADQQKYISTLSGGEMRRLNLAAVLVRQPNFLILDEPTNDLDIMTLGILEEYLREFKGCVIVISHDRFFLDSIVDHLFVMEGNGVIKDFPGNYSDYREYLREQKANEEQKAAQKCEAQTKSRSRENSRPAKMSFKERKEFEELTAEIDRLTAERHELETVFNSGEQLSDIEEKARRYSELKDLLDEKEMRWLELSEKA